MKQKKVSMLGMYAVGKTSLVARFVHSKFSEKYLTTLGVKIDRKQVDVDGETINMLLWDIHGEDDYQTVKASYVRGSSGYLLVADGTREQSLDVAVSLKDRVEAEIGKKPFLLLVNKADLEDRWTVRPERLQELEDAGWIILRTSAKSGLGVAEAFDTLAKELV